MRVLQKVFPYLLFLFFVGLYVHNLSRSVYGGDVGDLVTAATVGGVAHPPGYPLFVFLGFLLIHTLPIFTPAFSMGLISVFAGACGIVVCYFLIRELTHNTTTAIVTSVTLGFSYLYWFYSEIAEVFALNSFFILLLFYLAVRFDKTRKQKFLLLLSFVFGLASVTHQIIVLFLPSLFLIVFPGFFRAKKKIFLLLASIGVFLSAWLIYGYVFIASAHHPVVNWDNVHDLQSFLRLILRSDYGTFQAGLFAQPVFAQRVVIVKTYLFSILTQVTIPVVGISLFGVLGLWKKSKRYIVSFLLAFLIPGPLFIAYTGFPIEGSFFLGVYERFFTMSAIPIFFFFGVGLFTFAKGLATLFDRKIYFLLFQLVFLLIPLQLFLFNMPKTDLSNVWTGDTLGADFLTPLPKHAIVLLSGDTSLFNTWYMHYARGVRPDITLINLAMISLDPRIHAQEQRIRSQQPHLTQNELIAKTLFVLAKNYAIFSYDNLESPGKTTLKWIPTGLLYQLVLPSTSLSEKQFLQINTTTLRNIHLPVSTQKNFRNLTIAEIPQIYAKSIWTIGNYAKSVYKDPNTALFYYQKALTVDPEYENAYITRGLLYLTQNTKCGMAEENFKQAIATTPYDELPYFLLYTTYTECYHDKKDATIVTGQFTQEFHKNFYVELLYELRQIKK